MRALHDKGALGGPPTRPAPLAELDLGPLPERGERILRAAEPFLGAPYKLGGDTAAGIDCSGLTKAVFARFGCDLPRQSRLQADRGTPVDFGALAPGDLLFFSTNRDIGINHVGIYLGGGRMLHSSSMDLLGHATIFGADTVLEKPFDETTLLVKVRELIGLPGEMPEA